MRVVITGGTGLIGRALAEDLVSDGHEVIVLSRDPARARGLPQGTLVLPWDGRTVGGWAEALAGADAAVNLAGENIGSGRWTAERKRRIRGSRVGAGLAIVQAIRSASDRPRVLVQASATGYYGPRSKVPDEVVDEDTPPGSDFLAEVCLEWEASTRAAEDLGVRRAVLRTGVVLARGGGALPRMVLPFRFFAGGPLGSGRQWLPWIHLSDEVAAIRFLIDNESASGAFNLTAPEPVTSTEFARTLGRVLGRSAAFRVPAAVLRLAFGEMATVLLDGQRAVPSRLGELGFRFRYPELDSALRDVLG